MPSRGSPSLCGDQEGWIGQPGWAYKVGQNDLRLVREADGIFAVVNGCPPDEGVMVELGMAIAWGKPTRRGGTRQRQVHLRGGVCPHPH